MAPEFGWEVGMLLDVRSGPIFLSLYRTMYEALVRRLHDNGCDNNDSVIRERQRTCARETERGRSLCRTPSDGENLFSDRKLNGKIGQCVERRLMDIELSGLRNEDSEEI